MGASPSATKTVATQELPYPIIKYAANNSLLYPIDAIDGTTATLTLPAGATTVVLYVSIKGQDEPAFDPISVPDGIDVVDISAQMISYCIGHTVLFKYSATVGGRVQESLTLELEVQQIRENDLVVSRPVFVHAKNESNTWWLRMQSFTGDEIVEIKAWPMIYEGQRLFVTVAGNQHVTPYRFIWVALDHVVQANEAHEGHVFRFALSRGWLSRLEDYSAITAHLGVIWDKTDPIYPEPGDPLLENPLPLNAEDFHLRTTSLLQVDAALDLNPPHLRESVELPPGQWQVNPTNTLKGGHAIVSYEGMFEGDHVCAQAYGPSFGPVALGCKDVKESETSLSFDVAPEIIAALFNKTLKLSYNVQFNQNPSQDSPEREIKVLAPQLTRPGIEQATGNTLDLNNFSGNATGVVPIWDYAAEGQCCWMWVEGVLEGGSPYRFDVLMDEPLTADWLAGGVDTPIPRAQLQKLADCNSFELHFAASFDGRCERETAIEFPLKTIDLVQEDLVLPHPKVCEAVGGQLTIWNGRDGVTVRVEYERMSPGHTIDVYWLKPDGMKLPLASQLGNSDPGYVDFAVPREAVIHGAGKTILISYTVTSACKLAPSKTLALTISVPVRLPTPVVPQATGGVLDLRTFIGNADITVEKWWFILPDQKVWLRGVGTKEDGTTYTLNVYLGKSVSAEEVSEGLRSALQRPELDLLKDRSDLTFTCKVTADGNPHESQAIVFPVLRLILRKAYKHLTDFNNRDWRGWTQGSGAPDSRDLSLEPQGGGGFALKNYSYSSKNIGPILQRTFTDLEQGRTYKFSVRVRRLNNANPTPKLSLRLNAVAKTAVVELIDLSWHTLGFTFVASSAPVQLEIYSHELDPAIAGNDYLMDDFLVEEV
ncbi:hypothetical protein CQZ99_00880 [Pseudomonas poae]|uniref:CBM-cenC domain-containing protein n=2 Tax=Pseudomonas poae TaxID=200451 RepID=A0A2S9F033_9PSED|nr:hypothetical protein CQZ97_07980 [Pseudomonas poae]PRC23083.1 hypothetical protein CQZ99_00880 [Pseudomonas poae]